jgi:hypothetical protein
MASANSMVSPRPMPVQRLPWMRRIHVHSPKVGRTLVLFSYESLHAWALAESCPLITTFCEYPGYVVVDGKRVLANFWLQGSGRDEFVKLEDSIELMPELPDQVPTYTGVAIDMVPRQWFEPYQEWIDNWLRINPYLVSNARFVTPLMLERVAGMFGIDHPLFDVEHALRDVDPQLARTAAFMLLQSR